MHHCSAWSRNRSTSWPSSAAANFTVCTTCSVARCRRWTASGRIRELEERVSSGDVQEVVIATDPDVEGEATAYYLGERLAGNGLTVSRLAHGLPAGADLEYADELTVARAFTGRRAL